MTAALLLLITAALSGMFLILLTNFLAFPGLKNAEPGDIDLKTSILIPARDEVGSIGKTVMSLLRQSYSRFELLILDDHSQDGTEGAARVASQGDGRLRILPGRPIPRGWLAKNWACHQLATQANGDILIFTDADVQWQRPALSALLSEFMRGNADMLAVMPTQKTETWTERLCVPLMALALHAYLPAFAVHSTSAPLLAAANGQCIAFSRAAYDRLGGHTSVRRNILDDIGLARQAKRAGLQLRLVEADGLISCRMYRDWRTVREGYAKNILAGFGGVTGLLAATFFHWLVFLAPWVLLGLGFAGADVPGHPFWPGLLILAGFSLRGLTAWRTGQRVFDALLLPISVLLMSVVAAQSLWWHFRYGGPLWKGRRAIP